MHTHTQHTTSWTKAFSIKPGGNELPQKHGSSIDPFPTIHHTQYDIRINMPYSWKYW